MPEKDKLVCPPPLFFGVKFEQLWICKCDNSYVFCLCSCAGLEAEGSVSAAQTEQSWGYHGQTQDGQWEQNQKYISDIRDAWSFNSSCRFAGHLVVGFLFLISCRNRNRGGVTEQNVWHSVPVPCTSPRRGSHWCSSSPAAPGRVPVPDWSSTTGDRGKFPRAFVHLMYLQFNVFAERLSMIESV